MQEGSIDIAEAVNRLVDEYRHRCLWFLREDYYPRGLSPGGGDPPMALTNFQHTVCRLLADHRVASGESDVAGGTALNELIGASRISRDIDLFHDTDEALEVTWEADRGILEQQGFHVRIVRQRPAYVEAEVSLGGETVLMERARDSAYRFFPSVLDRDGRLFGGGVTELHTALDRSGLIFQAGRIRGAVPRLT